MAHNSRLTTLSFLPATDLSAVPNPIIVSHQPKFLPVRSGRFNRSKPKSDLEWTMMRAAKLPAPGQYKVPNTLKSTGAVKWPEVLRLDQPKKSPVKSKGALPTQKKVAGRPGKGNMGRPAAAGRGAKIGKAGMVGKGGDASSSDSYSDDGIYDDDGDDDDYDDDDFH